MAMAVSSSDLARERVISTGVRTSTSMARHTKSMARRKADKRLTGFLSDLSQLFDRTERFVENITAIEGKRKRLFRENDPVCGVRGVFSAWRGQSEYGSESMSFENNRVWSRTVSHVGAVVRRATRCLTRMVGRKVGESLAGSACLILAGFPSGEAKVSESSTDAHCRILGGF